MLNIMKDVIKALLNSLSSSRKFETRNERLKVQILQLSSMIHLARPTVSPVANIVFAWNLFCFESGDVRTNGRHVIVGWPRGSLFQLHNKKPFVKKNCVILIDSRHQCPGAKLTMTDIPQSLSWWHRKNLSWDSYFPDLVFNFPSTSFSQGLLELMDLRRVLIQNFFQAKGKSFM